jgi:nucleoid DNA-binding protein
MTKADIVDRIQTSTGNTQKASYDLFEVSLEIIKETLVSGEEVIASRVTR